MDITIEKGNFKYNGTMKVISYNNNRFENYYDFKTGKLYLMKISYSVIPDELYETYLDKIPFNDDEEYEAWSFQFYTVRDIDPVWLKGYLLQLQYFINYIEKNVFTLPEIRI